MFLRACTLWPPLSEASGSGDVLVPRVAGRQRWTHKMSEIKKDSAEQIFETQTKRQEMS